ncbi:hypothetical protein DZB84_14920 [Bacillus sp. HNG]|uniref:hypothetical protein n=1 Tax=Bacillus sp. HNG TaxID=2293325 RepID=UPI000E2F8F6D|nr:hypothetical protein [Bacillus sp. HNG]RFB14736.1 hypothetical protein DZB84_14920 [Bacillus sp. HNG]
MRKTIFLTIVFLLVTSAFATALSWAYIFVVHDGKVYEVKEEMLLDQSEVGKMIGKVETKADEYTGDYYGNASNYYEIGIGYFKIEDIPINEAIAVETEEGHYVKAVYVHDAAFSFKNVLMRLNFWAVFGVGIVLLVGITVLRSKQRRFLDGVEWIWQKKNNTYYQENYSQHPSQVRYLQSS